MARKKVKLAWISNDSSRRATLKKRNKGLMKKVSELSTLCAVTACAIVFPPPNSTQTQPEIWPPSTSQVHRVIARFAELPQMERTKRMMNQEGFLRHTASKVKEQLKRQQRENREHNMTLLMYQCLDDGEKGLHQLDSLQDLNCLGTWVDEIINKIRDRVEELDHRIITTKHNHHHDAEDDEIMNNLDAAMEALQSQSWFKSIITSQTHPPPQINYNVGDDLEALLWGY